MDKAGGIGQAFDGHLVGHVVVVGFHAQLGSQIEFSYPSLRGSPELRTPGLSDSQDVAGDPVGRRATYASQPRGDWGQLPEEWSFLPHLALPDGAHESEDDTVYFCLPRNIHCVACFRQTNAREAMTIDAGGGSEEDERIASRGSVQKSVVLMCKRPIYGILGERLGGVVRAYFDQGDFARTDVLAELFHSVNKSLSKPYWNNFSVLVHGLDLRTLVVTLKGDLLRVLKLILLEKRVVLVSQPVRAACNAVACLASVFPAAFDRMSPNEEALDSNIEDQAIGLPLEILSERDNIIFQPYAHLPLINNLLLESSKGCVLGTSRNCGVFLKTGMSSNAHANLPTCDAIVDVQTGQTTIPEEVGRLCALTREESLFMEDLAYAAGGAGQGNESPGTIEYVSSDDNLRERLRDYLRRLLRSTACINGVLQNSGPTGTDSGSTTTTATKLTPGSNVDWSPVEAYNTRFVKMWALTTMNGCQWASKCEPVLKKAQPPPSPAVLRSSRQFKNNFGLTSVWSWWTEEPRNTASGTSQSAVERMSAASARAVEGVSDLIHKLESELKSIETVIREKVEEGKKTISAQGATDLENKLEARVNSDSGDITNMKTPQARVLRPNRETTESLSPVPLYRGGD
uniref:AVL9/DENND6 domain-containing protein n=1 Tax=Rhodosorus marinus TaxID=101924 RepID=A0A7S2ZDL5_9RHOD|mmetsp:Transcript_14816/g.60211  ORF Transcript_14816/g.60211 Transcript_14816/m.60211 type:complete len:629 (-) Transcript_14816:1181-3067(-)|eukprot:CAMPEP_0113954756 /NCGR_PEP_ID=MMETSP0011_2-20120614/808_1 /TAXON_ID=101924 /ORGANISM="Rhodosorus marinus" /LENGTH=628 /DNA_ID=CAMNT_0000964077 /DNA_START=1042 /DNA_END=2928 /DNA_ORIENTATION=- /assembly_acc=CAM_ASM_000156